MAGPGVPFFRISLSNATLLSVLYLGAAVALELIRRAFDFAWCERALRALEAFPARILEWVGLLEPLRRAFLDDKIGQLHVRLIYGLTTVAIIFVLAVGVGGLMAASARVLSRAAQEPKA